MPSRFLLPVLALAVYNVGAAEFMLSPLLTPLAAAFDTTPAQASWLIASYARLMHWRRRSSAFCPTG